MVSDTAKERLQDHVRGVALKQPVGDRGELADPLFDGFENIFVHRWQGLDEIAARCPDRPVWLELDAHRHHRGGLLRLEQVVGDIFADLAGVKLDHPLIAVLDPDILGDGQKSCPAYAGSDIYPALLQFHLGSGVGHIAPHPAVMARLGNDLGQRPAAFKLELQVLSLFHEGGQQGRPGKGAAQGCAGGGADVMLAAGFVDQPGGVAGKAEEFAVVGDTAVEAICHGIPGVGVIIWWCHHLLAACSGKERRCS